MRYSLGIDLGTTYTAAAVSDGSHAEIVPLGDRSPQAPSVIYRAPDGSFRYGESAERHASTEPERIAREFKRRMGDKTPIFLAGAPMSAHALSKAMLGWTIERVGAGLGEPPDRVTVTCPANWGPYRRELMDQVTALNADYPITVCTEPAAAAVHFAATRRVPEGQAVAVYDLGGGTFDAAVLRRTVSGDFEVLGSPDGLEQLGGIDFDEAVFERVSRGIEWDRLDQEDPDNLTGLARLRRDCTEAKEALSSETETIVPITLAGRLNRVRLTRTEFSELITPLVADTVDILDRVIRRSGVPATDLAAIVLVGGSSRVPLVSELIARRFRRPAVLSAQPKLCVAMGAALLGGSAGRADSSEIPSVNAFAAAPLHSTASLGFTPTSPSTPASRLTSASPVAPAGAAHPTGLTIPADPPTPSGFRTPATGVNLASPAGDVSPAPPTSPIEPGQPAGVVIPRRLAGYPLVSAACAVLALLLMVLGPAADKTGPTWDSSFDVDATGQPPGATLTATIFGFAVIRPPTQVNGGVFDLEPRRIFLSGPTRGRIANSTGSRDVVLYAANRWSASRWISMPFAALALTALFSFAYAESILRPIRKRRTRVAPSEVVGLVGSGLVAGVAAVLATWVVGDRLPDVTTALAICVLVCASVGLLAFSWSPKT